MPLSGGRAGSPSNTMSPVPRSSSLPSGILIHQPFDHNRHRPKIGGLLSPFFGRVDLTQCVLRPTSVVCTTWHLDPSSRLATIHGPKSGGAAVTLFLGVPIYHNVAWPRPTSVPTDILIHPAVWPQQTWAKNWGMCPFWGSWVPI